MNLFVLGGGVDPILWSPIYANGEVPPKRVPLPNAAGSELLPNPVLLPVGVLSRSTPSGARVKGPLEPEDRVAASDFGVELKLGLARTVAVGLPKALGEDSFTSVTTCPVEAAIFGPNSALMAGEPNFRGSNTIISDSALVNCGLRTKI